MKEYVWLFPIIFIFHDMEEIIGFGLWLRKNKLLLLHKYPKILKTYKDFSTEGFALAVFEELIICIAFSAAVFFTDNEILRYLWLGSFLACTLHFLIHIVQSLIMRRYIPAVITSVLCLPISILILCRCFTAITNIYFAVIFIFIGIIIVALNLYFAQKMIGWFTRKMRLKPLI